MHLRFPPARPATATAFLRQDFGELSRAAQGKLGRGSFAVARDAQPPTVAVHAPRVVVSPTFEVSWAAGDGGAGLGGVYDVQVWVDGGAWSDWLTGTADTSAPFTGEVGHRYSFRVRTWDRVGNERPYPDEPDAETHVRAAVTKYYYLGGQRVALRQGDVVYVLSDHLGSTSVIADGGGAVVARQRYLPYGATRHASGGRPTDYGFTGQRYESAIGLYFYQARYYDPYVGRFISADTVVPEAGEPQALNRYSYALNNPMKYVDPSGHCWGPAGGLRNVPGYGTLCGNLDMAILVAGHPDASAYEKAAAVAYVEWTAISHLVLLEGLAILSVEAAVGLVEGVSAIEERPGYEGPKGGWPNLIEGEDYLSPKAPTLEEMLKSGDYRDPGTVIWPREGDTPAHIVETTKYHYVIDSG